jgi:3-deoxy-D-manno-octulosonic-acid transferase
MVPVGGHNILEPLAVGTPVLFGPYMANFKEIAQGVLKQDAAIQCQTKNEIVAAIADLYADAAYRQAQAEKGRAFVRQNQGAITRIFDILNQDI